MSISLNGEVLAFVLYFVLMLAIGLVLFFVEKKKGQAGEEDYFLGGRSMGPWVTAMSAQASDMSGWLLMGLPGSILALGFGQVWVSIGLAIGTYLNWRFTAARLRRFSKAADDSITIPQYLSNRFCTANPVLRIVCALVFLVFFTVYVASSFKAGGVLFSTVMGIDASLAMIIFAAILVAYTFLGGFKAVCWTDFFQGLMMLVAMLLVPIMAVKGAEALDFSAVTSEAPNYFNLLPSGKFDYASISEIVSGLAWGLGYFGMPHIIVRFMAIKKSSMIKTSRVVATVWVLITLAMACVIGALGRVLMPAMATDGTQEQVFIVFVRNMFPAFIAGILLSAILAAAMSTADSQLLVASSSVASDIYKPIFRKKASDKEMLWVGRIAVIVIAVVAFVIANDPNSGNIMNLVSNAWGGFGAAFGPTILLSLYWKRFTYPGAIAGILAGGIADVAWLKLLTESTGIYELLPGFVVGLIVCILVSLITKKPGENVQAIYDKAVKDDSFEDEEVAAVETASAEAAAVEETAETVEAVEEAAPVEEAAAETVEAVEEAAPVEEAAAETAEAVEEAAAPVEEAAAETVEAVEETAAPVEEAAAETVEAVEEAAAPVEEAAAEAAEAVEETVAPVEEAAAEVAETVND